MKKHCEHLNKRVTDGFNMDDEVYYECPDCGAGWRSQPENEEDGLAGWKIFADLVAIGFDS